MRGLQAPVRSEVERRRRHVDGPSVFRILDPGGGQTDRPHHSHGGPVGPAHPPQHHPFLLAECRLVRAEYGRRLRHDGLADGRRYSYSGGIRHIFHRPVQRNRGQNDLPHQGDGAGWQFDQLPARLWALLGGGDQQPDFFVLAI